MGSGYYHQDVRTARAAIGTQRTSNDAFQYSERAKTDTTLGLHANLNIRGRVRESCDSDEHPLSTPIVVAMDVTSSRGDDAKRIYSQVPSFLGSLIASGVVPDPQIMWAAIGDANTDRAPIQVGQFESDKRIDEFLSNIWLEEGGGGTGEESYELLAYYLANRTKLDCLKRKKKGFLFFTGDEAPYDTVSPSFVRTHIGDELSEALPTAEVFRKLQEKYHTFLIFPRSSMEARKSSIDTEIRKRLEKAGGRFKNVDIRVSLIWDTRDDLDLHCMTPDGYHIFYGSKKAHCGGELDVDRNVSGEDPKPVENIRWAQGDAKSGTYQFWVELYGHHESPARDISFKCEIEVNGEISTFEGVAKAHVTHTRIEVAQFDFAPARSKVISDDFAAYDDEVILGKWSRYIPKEQILRVAQPESVVEVMLAVLALQSGSMNLDQFIDSMRERSVASSRQDDVVSAIESYAKTGIFQQVDASVFA